MALQPVVRPPKFLTPNSFILHDQFPVATPEKSGSIFFYTFLPFEPESPHWSITSKLSLQGFPPPFGGGGGYTVKKESLYVSSPF